MPKIGCLFRVEHEFVYQGGGGSPETRCFDGKRKLKNRRPLKIRSEKAAEKEDILKRGIKKMVRKCSVRFGVYNVFACWAVEHRLLEAVDFGASRFLAPCFIPIGRNRVFFLLLFSTQTQQKEKNELRNKPRRWKRGLNGFLEVRSEQSKWRTR